MDRHAIQRVLNTMSLEQLREVNRMVVNCINQTHREIQARALTRFRPGDLVEFVVERDGRTARARVESLNQKTLSAIEVGGPDRSRIGLKWRVSPSMCRLVGA